VPKPHHQNSRWFRHCLSSSPAPSPKSFVNPGNQAAAQRHRGLAGAERTVAWPGDGRGFSGSRIAGFGAVQAPPPMPYWVSSVCAPLRAAAGRKPSGRVMLSSIQPGSVLYRARSTSPALQLIVQLPPIQVVSAFDQRALWMTGRLTGSSTITASVHAQR
jgi:hypothetical protein